MGDTVRHPRWQWRFGSCIVRTAERLRLARNLAGYAQQAPRSLPPALPERPCALRPNERGKQATAVLYPHRPLLGKPQNTIQAVQREPGYAPSPRPVLAHKRRLRSRFPLSHRLPRPVHHTRNPLSSAPHRQGGRQHRPRLPHPEEHTDRRTTSSPPQPQLAAIQQAHFIEGARAALNQYNDTHNTGVKSVPITSMMIVTPEKEVKLGTVSWYVTEAASEIGSISVLRRSRAMWNCPTRSNGPQSCSC